MTSLKALGGTSDILPPESRRWQRLEESARRLMNLYGYEEIRTPLIEEAAVFTRSLGDAAEIVTKQMYLFEDRGGRSVALRPEGTASVVRAFIEHGLDKTSGLTRFYYVGPMFRAERPQAGRRRQFHQLGVEVFGSMSPYQDAEVLRLLTRLMEGWKITGWTLKLNSLGCRADRPKILQFVREKLIPHQAKLCPECQKRLENNPLRILDCKEEACQAITAGIDLSLAVCADCEQHFQTVVESLALLKVPFERDPHLVRGLDYYTRTAFEVVHGGLGSQNALGGGGRYDELVGLLGGSNIPAIGFAVGLERVLMAQEAQKNLPADPDGSGKVFVATVSPAQIPAGLALTEMLRTHGICASVNLEERPLKRQLEYAARQAGQGIVLILGEDELAHGVVTVRQMATGTQEQVVQADLVRHLKSRFGWEK